MLSEDRVEITLNDQRRLFSDAYENLILAARPALIEVSAHSPIAQMEAVAPAELKNFPCILIAPPPEREAEQEFSRIVLGFPSEFLYAENLEVARLLVAGGRGFHGERFHVMHRVGKKAAGRLLDGQEWSQMPGVA